MDLLEKSVLVFSSERAELGLRENQERTAEAEDLLTEAGIDFKRAEGCYQGSIEQSFIVSSEHEGRIRELCMSFEQECYLKIDRNRVCTFEYPGGSSKVVGILKSAPANQVLSDYTLVDGIKYYIAQNG